VDEQGRILPAEMRASDLVSGTPPVARTSYEYTLWSSAWSGVGYTHYQSQWITPVVETPATNVVEVAETRTPTRIVAVSLLVPGGLATIIGALLTGADLGAGPPVLIAGLALDAGGLYHLVWPGKTAVVYPGGE
jgi:hypothetical protein